MTSRGGWARVQMLYKARKHRPPFHGRFRRRRLLAGLGGQHFLHKLGLIPLLFTGHETGLASWSLRQNDPHSSGAWAHLMFVQIDAPIGSKHLKQEPEPNDFAYVQNLNICPNTSRGERGAGETFSAIRLTFIWHR